MIKRFLRTLVVLITLLAFSLPLVAHAEDKAKTAPTVTTSISMAPVLVPLPKGSAAPFSGVLLNPPAVAQITVDAKSAKKECDIRVDSEVAKEKAFSETHLKDKEGELKYVKDTLTEQIKLKDAEISRLQKETVGSAGSGVWWGVGGFAGGILVTVAIVFAVSASSK